MSSKKQYEEETGETYTGDYISNQKYKAWSYNREEGDANTIKCEFLKFEEKLDQSDIRYYDCPKCHNKGHVLIIEEDGSEVYQICECMETRNSLRKLYNSGLGELAKKYSFEKYRDEEQWQKYIKKTALEFLSECEKWFFIGGQVGCGKTFICTSIANRLIKQGKNTKYMLWVDESKKLKQSAMDHDSYQKMIEEYKNVPVLYIDDFLKTESLTTKPTAADFGIAYEILNFRYNNKGYITIISSEYSVEQITDMSEAVGSRIYEKSEGYNLTIKADRNKNMRYKKSTEL